MLGFTASITGFVLFKGGFTYRDIGISNDKICKISIVKLESRVRYDLSLLLLFIKNITFRGRMSHEITYRNDSTFSIYF